VDPADGAPAQADGDDFPDAEASDLLEQYVAADRDGRRKAAEQLGEAAGMAVLRRLTDDDGPDIRYPTADEPVPDSLALTPGVPWPTAFAFAGRNVTNIVWWDGDTVRVIEAKGGDSQYGTRQAGKDDAGQDLVVHQGSEAYLEKIADAMANSPKEDGRTTIGDILAEAIEDRIREAADTSILEKCSELEEGVWEQIEKSVLLQSLDHHWKEHLSTLDALRQVIHLRAYAQKTPINEYKREAFAMFERMLSAIREDVTKVLAYAQFRMTPPELPELPDFITTHIDPLTGEDDSADRDAANMGLITTRLPPLQIVQPDMDAALGDDPANWVGQVSRNAPCPCGSGNKYKHCHGAL